jgi:hypothetical protein
MTDAEASQFLQAAHARLEFCKMPGEVAVDGEGWLIGFVRGAPYVSVR